MNLGYKHEAVAPPPGQEPESKTHYPSLCLCEDPAGEFISNHKPKLGDTFKALVELKVTDLSDQYGKRVGFEVHELDAKPNKFEDKDPETQFSELKTEAEDY